MASITGRIFDIKTFAVHDGPGIRTTLFLKGCPLSCVWCHNPEGISAQPEIGYLDRRCVGCGACVSACPAGAQRMENGIRVFDRSRCSMCGCCTEACMTQALILYGSEITAEDAAARLLEDAAFYRQTGGGVTLSGGEPLVQSRFTAEVLRICREAGVHTAVDTSGAVEWPAFERVLPFTSLFLYDFKHIDDNEHIRLTGMSNSLMLSNLERLDGGTVEVEVRMPVLPGINDSDDAIDRAAVFLDRRSAVKAVRLLPFHDYARSKYSQIGLNDTIPNLEIPDISHLQKIAGRMDWIKPRIIIASGL